MDTQQKTALQPQGRTGLFDLFLTFAKIGVLTFGGGLAMLPMLQREVVEKKQWTTESEVMDYYSIGQCTPGIIAINTATFVGYKQRRVSGGIFATLGMVFPSLVIITILASVLQNFAHIIYVQQAFAGIRVAVCALIIQAITKLWKKSIVDIPTTCLFVLAVFLTIFLSVSAVYLVVIGIVMGLLIQFVRRSIDKKRGNR